MCDRSLGLRFVFSVLLSVILVSTALAQGEYGSLKTKGTTTTKKPTKPAAKKPPVKSRAKATTSTRRSKSAKVVLTSLVINAAVPNVEVFVSGTSGNVIPGGSLTTDADGRVVIEQLAVGNYSVRLVKPGYYEEGKSVALTAIPENVVSFNLRPSASFLTVTTNVAGANIEIEGNGEYLGSVDELLTQPGEFVVRVHKGGYRSESRTVGIRSFGERVQVSVVLEPMASGPMMAEAEAAFRSGDMWTASRLARRALASNPSDANANRVAGAALYRSDNPEDSTPYLVRLIGVGGSVSLPVRVYNKEKSNLGLIPGTFTIDSTSVRFNGDARTDLDFMIQRGAELEYFEKIDEFGITYINLKGRGDFAGRKDKRQIRLYPFAAYVKPSLRELGCRDRCAGEEGTLYDFILKWAGGSVSKDHGRIFSPVPPSSDFSSVGTGSFSLRIPENWTVYARGATGFSAGPEYGYVTTGGTTNLAYGIEALVSDNPQSLDAARASNAQATAIVTANPYLKRLETVRLSVPRPALYVTKFQGFSTFSKRTEVVFLYTLVISGGRIFSLIGVTSSNEAADYEPVFLRIVNSLVVR